MSQRRVAPAIASAFIRPDVSSPDLGQAEVEDLDGLFLILAEQDQVPRLDVAVDHAAIVGMLKSLRRLKAKPTGDRRRERSLLADEFCQIVPLHILHRKNEQVFNSRRRIGPHYVRMIESSGRFDLR